MYNCRIYVPLFKSNTFFSKFSCSISSTLLYLTVSQPDSVTVQSLYKAVQGVSSQFWLSLPQEVMSGRIHTHLSNHRYFITCQQFRAHRFDVPIPRVYIGLFRGSRAASHSAPKFTRADFISRLSFAQIVCYIMFSTCATLNVNFISCGKKEVLIHLDLFNLLSVEKGCRLLAWIFAQCLFKSQTRRKAKIHRQQQIADFCRRFFEV